jgi:signal transduction histidine kinase
MPLVPGLVNLELLGREVVDELTAANPNRILHFEASGDLACTCDSARIRQVISNLLGNAIAHGTPDAKVELSMASEGADVILSIRNQGPPIPPELLPTIFDPLVRDMSSDAQLRRRPGSVGLGLFIAREIVAAHSGRIDVKSSAESGTVFTVRFPRHRAVR